MALTQSGENQRKIGLNLSKIIGLKDNAEKMKALNMERQKGGFNAIYFNGLNAGTETGGTEPTCTQCGGGGGSGGGGSGGGGGITPGANCEKKNISELKQILDDYANQSFCDKEFPDVQFSTFIGKDSSGNDSEIRLLCPVDDCGHEQSYTYKIGTYRIPCDNASWTEVKFEHGDPIDDTFFEMKLKKFSSKQDFINFYNQCLNEAVALIDDQSCYDIVYANDNNVYLENNLGGTDTNLAPSAFYRVAASAGLKQIKRCYCNPDEYYTSNVAFCFMTAGGTYYPANQRSVSSYWCF